MRTRERGIELSDAGVELHVFLGPPPPGEEDMDLFEALQKQLGLMLVQKKRSIDNIVIDHIESTPTEN